MSIIANLLQTVNGSDAQRITLETIAQGTFLKIEELPHMPNGDGSDNWQPRAMIRLTDAIEATRAMVEAIKLLDPEDLGQDEPLAWDDGAVTRQEVGFDWERYMEWREQELDAMADAVSAHWGHD